MSRLIYSAISSLDGYIEDSDGRFDWCAPDEEVLSFINELERPIGTYLYGRRLYETMVFWETADATRDLSDGEEEFGAIWRAADKVVYSTTLAAPSSDRTRVERAFDPDAVRRLKEASPTDITVGGADLARHALAAALVDECQLFLSPVVVGGGKPALPSHQRIALELVDERRFSGGVVYLHYRLAPH